MMMWIKGVLEPLNTREKPGSMFVLVSL